MQRQSDTRGPWCRLPLRLVRIVTDLPMWMFRRSQTSQEKAVLGSEVFGFLEALNRWSVGDADQAIRKEYGDPIDTIDRGQTGKGPWQACERWLSDKWRGSDGVWKFSGCFKSRKQGLQMVHIMFCIFYLPVSAASIADTRQQASAEAVTIPFHEVPLPYYSTPTCDIPAKD
ncbi:hypothetical protein NA56DRAFT_713200 [Hyaloscypha hepaticicola]|uniref:Uncharacterized protein n=1 Tax=Hyaloscypha hepaticicola TaxID=2082293 RepID=A0A2J6PEP7_9HELO|nr:hypothetical protein NA56DRAFT_713200 [Hyaloscypha hepaticicola]